MEYLVIDPDILLKKLVNDNLNDNYQFTFLIILNDYIPTNFYNKYLNNLSEYKLKNIWNHIVIKWIKMHNELSKKNEKGYLNSVYYKQKYYHTHEIINKTTLDNLIKEFIGGDIFKAFFAVNCIQNYFIDI